MNAHSFHGSNGTLTLDLGWKGAFQTLKFVGGPYDKFPGRDVAFGVCVRAERVKKDSFDVQVPIADFGVPTNDTLVRKALGSAFEAALAGRPVYVGCMGGFGRTGLFLALVAKAAGVSDPVQFVRDRYYPSAVETKAQEAYVAAFVVGDLRSALLRASWRARIRKLLPFWQW